MQQYLQLLKDIKEKGTVKPPARENMPGSLSLFGYQMRFNLAEGFPIMTTKKVKFSNIVTELLWFLRGDINVKYLNDNGFTLWNQDAYNYYKKIASANNGITHNDIYLDNHDGTVRMFQFEEFEHLIKNKDFETLKKHYSAPGYTLGDCGYQYGKVWRDWEGNERTGIETHLGLLEVIPFKIDQIKRVYESLKNSPEGRRHIVTATDPAHDDDLALYWCHNFFQFNCRPMTLAEREEIFVEQQDKEEMQEYRIENGISKEEIEHGHFILDDIGVPRYYLDCQFYQRSGDTFLGVPYNTSSYALLTHLFCKLLNMIPGDLIHTFGDVHIYDNHTEQVEEQLLRTPDKLPTLKLFERDERGSLPDNFDKFLRSRYSFEDLLDSLDVLQFRLEGYNPQKAIKAKLSTGLK